jgi:GT2 family glycosyltransferase
MSEKKVSVIILNWNGSQMMRRFLPSVVSCSQEAEVIVADNGSTDGSLDMLRREFPEVTLMPFDKNYGFAEGYNKAIARIDTPYALLLNDDVEVTPHWLQPLLEFMDRHPEAAAC